MTRAVARGELDLPRAGRGATPGRWATLARWGRDDLAFARLAEGHVDALAVLEEAGAAPRPGARYGVWAARSGGTGADLVDGPGDGRGLSGIVRFCSGAHLLDRALVVALGPGGSRIADIALDDPRVRPVPGTWRSHGMAASDSADVELDGLPVTDDQLLGPPGFYTGRTGFWWGGGGVAAVWLGGAAGVCDDLAAALGERDPDPHQLAGFGALHTALAATDALLSRTAERIDADPGSAHRDDVWTARAAAENVCRTVLDAAPRIAGAATLTRDHRFADRLTDLQVYSRQHHGDRDLADLGRALLDGRR
ncbi:acyl-CoA dehydrogenase [Pseudonocardia sp. KRD-291]|nr:acyl-CoA dehydrogenase [Pseudonocardia sp. KRD291]